MTESIDQETGEILPDAGRDRAASGEIIQTTALSLGHFLDFMEDGQFSQDVIDQIEDLGAKITDLSGATGNKVKGKVTIEIDIEKDGENFTVQGTLKVKEPVVPRPRSIMWADTNNRFTRFPPNQRQMFGTRRPVRNV